MVEGVQTLADLAELLRQLRRRHAREQGDTPLTYRELAAKTGWAHGIIGDYFAGKTLPPTDRFDVLIALLHRRVHDLPAVRRAPVIPDTPGQLRTDPPHLGPPCSR